MRVLRIKKSRKIRKFEKILQTSTVNLEDKVVINPFVEPTKIEKIESKIESSQLLTPKDKKVQPPPLFGVKSDSVTQQLLRTDKSTSNPNVELARIVSVLDMVMDEFGWEDCKFSQIIRDAQASVDGKYHNDIKEVAISQEIEQRNEKKGNKSSIE